MEEVLWFKTLEEEGVTVSVCVGMVALAAESLLG